MCVYDRSCKNGKSKIKMYKLSLMRNKTSKLNTNKAYYADLMIEILKDKYVSVDRKKHEEK
jgi:hypothetical protein